MCTVATAKSGYTSVRIIRFLGVNFMLINSHHSTAPMSLLRWVICVLFCETILSSILLLFGKLPSPLPNKLCCSVSINSGLPIRYWQMQACLVASCILLHWKHDKDIAAEHISEHIIFKFIQWHGFTVFICLGSLIKISWGSWPRAYIFQWENDIVPYVKRQHTSGSSLTGPDNIFFTMGMN